MHPTNRPRFASLLPVVSLVLLSFACSDPNDPVGVPPAPTLAPTTQWAGGIVRLTLESIDASDPAPSLLLDGADALPVVQVGDGFADYRLPGDVHGPVDLSLEGDDPVSFDVEVLGYRAVHSLGVSIEGNLLVWPRTGPASLLAVRNGTLGSDGGVIQILPGSMEANDLVADSSIFWGTDVRSVAPTYDADRVVLLRAEVTNTFPNDQWTELWQLSPAAEVLDTLPVMFMRHAMLLSDSVYVFSSHHMINVTDPRSVAAPAYAGNYEESRGVVVSPTGKYGAFRVNGSLLGPPVFSASSLAPAFHVDTLFRSYGVDFSPVGDTLYIAGVGRTPTFEQMLFAIDATTGEIVDGLGLGEREAINIARDPAGPWLYVVADVLTSTGASANEPLVLIVVDTRTMEIVGEATTSGYSGECVGWCEGSVAVGTDGVFFVSTGEHPLVLTFDRGPAD